MSNLKIAIIVDSLDSKLNSGINTYIKNLISAILKIDTRNEYYLVHGEKIDLPFEEKYVDYIIPYFRLDFLNVLRNFYLAYRLNKLDFDIIHSPHHDGPFLNHYKFKKVITIHDIVNYLFPWHRNKSSLIYLKNKIYFPLILRFCDCIITVSDNTKKDLVDKIKISPKKISRIYEARSDNFRKLSPSELKNIRNRYKLPKNFILFVGTIEPRKNIITLLRAFLKLFTEKNHKDYSFVVVGGKGWKNKNVYEFIEKNNLNEKVRFFHNMGNDELVYFYNLADIFVLPTLYEGFGLPPLESMSCGCPVITSNNSSLPEVVGDAALLLEDPLDENELADKMNELIINKSLRDKLIQKGFKQVNKFSWVKAAEETINLYERVSNQN